MNGTLFVGVIGESNLCVGQLVAHCARLDDEGQQVVVVGGSSKGAGRLAINRARSLGVQWVECGHADGFESDLVASLATELWYFIPESSRDAKKDRDAFKAAVDRGIRAYAVTNRHDLGVPLARARSDRDSAAGDRGGARGHTVGGRG